MTQATASTMTTHNLSVRYGKHLAVDQVSLSIHSGQVTAIIGPSGCGKSTFIRCLNRMHDFIAGVEVDGQILLDGVDIYGPSVDPVSIRRRVGMVFQKPNPFPHMSIMQNVLSGFAFTRKRTSKSKEEIAEIALKNAALFDEVKDRLNAPSGALSGGQQQRLCIARALAMEPEVLLLDEPCSALDPISTARIEDLIHTLRTNYAIVIVTHNMQQAARVSQVTAYFLSGKLIEVDETRKLFTNPADQRTEDYITGKFG
ncbi:MAG TPA: phosphate ABC transporter ATP-binding protein PstB [Myxococcota bacterium]|nr:phosphate ABC transporter ATP-binding protein PstB [Myxococcota bacterium]